MKLIFSAISFLFFVFSAFYGVAQNGSLIGIIVDGETKETTIGANILLLGSDYGTATDLDGFYSINNIAPGTYNVRVSYTGYEEVLITGIEIKPNEKQKLDVVLSSSTVDLQEITITEYRKTNTVALVLLEMKQSKQVVSGVSGQQIQRSQDNNAAQVMQRIPGVTIVDNRFVMIRGLAERYNNVMVNNVVAPSTEIDKRTFSFDLIASSSLDRMLIYKSGTADMPGDFAGGVIKLFTVDDVESNFTKLNLGVGYRANTTFQPYFQSEGSPTDFLGFDSGFRRIPSGFPSINAIKDSPRNAQLRQDAAHSLPNNFKPLESTAIPDYSFGLTLGRKFNVLNKQVSTITSVNYSQAFQYYRRDFFRYFEWVDQTQPILQRFQYDDDVYEKQNRITVMSNWKMRLGQNSRISFKNLFNQIGENETNIRNGFDFIQRPGDNLRNYMLGYRSRSIYTGQFEGVHDITPMTNLRWVAGGSFVRELEPDLRRFRTFQQDGQTDLPFTMQMPPSSNLFDTGRYHGELFEYSFNQGLDYTRKLNVSGNRKANIKAGYLVDYRNRDFKSRYFSYLYPGFFDPAVREELIIQPLEQIFSNENVKTRDGFVLEEGTRLIDSYDASSLNTAGYIGTESSFGALDITAGIRGEYNIQKLNTQDDISVINVNNPVFSFLPFLNAGYNLSENSLIRLAYSRTVNRPEFRELAPFLFYDYKLDAGRVGNPNLVTANIQNIDLRYEWYPRIGETISIGAFYKYFNDPIENRTVITTEQPQFTYFNADWAQNYGIELEVRKSFRGVTGSSFLDRFSLNANAAFIRSKVDLGEGVSNVQDQVRPLQGQSPYIVNLAAYYEDNESNVTAALIYNIFGNRIFSVGDVLFPTIYELSRNSLDFTISKRFDRVTYKLGIQNLLDAPFRFYQDSDRNEKINLDLDDPIFTFRRGQLVSLSLSFDLNK